jgi:ABC-2 type transport system ATP-binding protein
MTTAHPDTAVLVKGLSRRYETTDALKDLSLTVQHGEIFGLLGPNGAGKTTLIKTLVGALRPTSGEVTVLGRHPIRDSRDLHHRIGYMPQASALYEDLSALDNVRFFAQAHRLPDLNQRVQAVLEFIHLLPRQHDPVSSYSGGMKQRVSLACALVHQPRLLLLDEPTAGIDPKLREAFWQHFRALAQDGVTILVSTHQMDEALHCDRLAVMRAGVLLACDTPRGLLWRGQTRVNIWRGEQRESEVIQDPPEQLPRLLQRYRLDPAITRIEIEADTLETIVLNMINTQEATFTPSKEVQSD